MASRYDHTTSRLSIFLIGCVVIGPAFVSGQEKKREPALGGHCLVAYFEKEQAVKGDPAYQVEHIGEVYYFSSAEAKKKFEALPHKYLPKLGSLCTMALGGPYGTRLPCDPTSFTIVEGKLYMFSQERAKRLWEKTPKSVIKQAHERFEQPRLSGYCPVSYQRDGKAVKGNPSLRSVYKTRLYHMASGEAKTAFDLEPERYVPPYGKYCATNMANHLMKPFDPTLFRVMNGRTYLFHNEEAQKQFDANPQKIIKKADAWWAYVRPKKR
ncbi:MAG: YHS domain-containing (seleno)protein [Planctomycetota bacterium]|jgi:YHS domain-containing protein